MSTTPVGYLTDGVLIESLANDLCEGLHGKPISDVAPQEAERIRLHVRSGSTEPAGDRAKKLIVAIRNRLDRATPGPWSIALGSGTNLCTAVVNQREDGTTVFVADCLPDWALSCAEPNHVPNMEFIANARADMETLLARVAVAEADRFCEWSADEGNVWYTRCGNAYQFGVGGPEENKAQFCQYCGAHLVPVPFTESSEESEGDCRDLVR